MVWWAQRIGEGWHIKQIVMGTVLLAAGTSVPEVFSSVGVTKEAKVIWLYQIQ